MTTEQKIIRTKVGVPLTRVLTERGGEYCGAPDQEKQIA